jgi:hypothetical protein
VALVGTHRNKDTSDRPDGYSSSALQRKQRNRTFPSFAAM